MRLDRNITNPKRGKYALVKLRTLPAEPPRAVVQALHTLEQFGALDWGNTDDSDFFVIRLKDKYAAPALSAYAEAAYQDDTEYAHEVMHLASLAETHPGKRKPD